MLRASGRLFRIAPSYCGIVAFLLACAPLSAAEFASDWRQQHDRVWLGEAYWANPMEDWRLAGGRIECVTGSPQRNVHVLTHQLSDQPGNLAMRVRLGRVGNEGGGAAGFLIGVTNPEADYRNNLLFGQGLAAGIDAEGRLFIGKPKDGKPAAGKRLPSEVELRLSARPGKEHYRVTLAAHAPSGKKLGEVAANVQGPMRGNLALMQNPTGRGKPRRAPRTENARWWFADWKIAGSKVAARPEQRFGPILFALYSLSRDVMKMTAHMPPLGRNDQQAVELAVQSGAGTWQTMAVSSIDPRARTATFRVEDWPSELDVPYRLIYRNKNKAGEATEDIYPGTVRREPDQGKLVVAGFTGNTDPGFPNALLARNVGIHNPDVLVFTGDQIYENVGGYGIFREPVPLATLNYLRKWWLWGWAFRDLTRDRPTLCFPDDHDVYQGNIWGAAGKPVPSIREHSQGGYAMPADWVNMIQQTQTSHHPDPHDPTPVQQGITVYYGDMLYGRVSFALLEDRKFKSGPENKVNTWPGRPDHVKDPKIDIAALDKPNLKLLGERQLDFLNDWAADWRGADLKMVCSQTIFCNLANYHGSNKEYLIADLDSNGWPQTGRDKALDAMRRGFAFHLAGDQHLASIVHHGIDTWNDAGYSFCVPSIAAGYPRAWRPDAERIPVQNRPQAGLPNTGEYRDGLHNYVTVYAIANPAEKNRPGRINTLHDKASGYGLVRLDTKTGKITLECWRLQFDAADPQPQDQFPGWPMTIDYQENYGRKAAAWLPTIEVAGMTNPVVQVIDPDNDEIVYTLRIRGATFRPKIFRDSAHTIRVGDPDSNRWQVLEDIRPMAADAEKSLNVEFK